MILTIIAAIAASLALLYAAYLHSAMIALAKITLELTKALEDRDAAILRWEGKK